MVLRRGMAVLAASVALVVLVTMPTEARGGPVFTATLTGDAERPTPNDSDGFGTGGGELTGGPGAWVFTYEVTYGGLTGPAGLGHIHHATEPPGEPDPRERFGGIVRDFPQLISPITDTWRFDDPVQPLTDELADALLNEELYFNLHTDQFPAGEIRGQITIIPLPAPALAGLLGLATAAAAMYGRRARRPRG